MLDMSALLDFMPLKMMNRLPFEDYFFDVKRESASQYTCETTEDGLELQIDLPGVVPSDLNVQAEGNLVKITAQRKGAEIKQRYKIARPYDASSAAATLENGVLSLKFAKLATEAAKSIPIQCR
jgi:HSP20 family molecular chaperone IbpA